ncbi:MAG: Uma2 family endonuclease [bacterium]|nr:Uma2 family endonuclease [bacterium]MCY3952094.1 Uma2 family endonuclease [bacterium]MCY4104108.1 Uma2 family endonuclease [bacterium]
MSLLAEMDPDVAYPATASVPDSDLHSRVRFLTYGALREHYAGRGDCYVGQDLNIYYRRGHPRAVAAPDVFVCFGVDPESLLNVASYRVWEVGAPPAFVLEIASKKTFPADVEVKPQKYLDMGVEEYWRFDPTGGEFFSPILQAERRADDRWAPIAVDVDDAGRFIGHSRALGLDLHAETQRLRFRDPTTGDPLLDPTEMRQDRDAAVARAQAAEAELAALRAALNNQP